MIEFTGGLLPLALVIGVIALVVRSVQGNDREVDWGRVVLDGFQHATTVVLAFIATSGVASLAEVVLDGPGSQPLDEVLAAPLTFTVVGLPLFVAALWWVLRRVRRDADMRESLSWAAHLGIVEIVALVTVVVSAHGVASFVVEGARFPDDSWAGPAGRLAAFGMLWGCYRVVAARDGGRRWAIVHVLVGSAVGLVTLAIGLGQVLEGLFERLLFAPGGGIEDGNAMGLVLVALGGLVWTTYWLADGISRERDAWWYGYVLLGPMLTGLLTTVGALGYVVHTVAVWFAGVPDGGFDQHMAEVPGALAVAIVAAAAWFVHRALLVARARRPRSELDRIHDLVVAGVGLVAAAGGLGAILVAVVEVTFGPSTSPSVDEPINTLLAAVTFLAIGGPIWWRAWQPMQRLARRPPREPDVGVVDDPDPGVAERHSPTRRLYLFSLFGIGGLVGVVTVLFGVVGFVEDLLAGDLGRTTILDARVALATVVVVGGVAGYHWTVWRRDVELAGQDPPRATDRRHPRHVTLIGVADESIVSELRTVTSGRVELWARDDVVTPPWDRQRLADDLATHDVDHVVVVADRTGHQVIPIRD